MTTKKSTNDVKVQYSNKRLYVNGVAAQRILRNGKIVLISAGNPDVEVAFVPCHVCDRSGKRSLGSGEFGGLGRCAACEGKGKLYPADVQRNAAWKRAQLEGAEQQQNAVAAEFEQQAFAVAAGASK